MKFLTLIITAILFFSLSLTPAYTQVVEQLKWEDLIPQQHRTTDPLAHLPQEIVDEIEWVIYLRLNLPSEITSDEEEYYNEMFEALPKLKANGIDIDEIIADRKVKETTINTALNGKYVRLPGYLLPLEVKDDRVSEFLLVPFVGACIHVPPPPPNQIVHGTTKKSIEYDMDELFKPIWITGTLKAKSISKELFLQDGSDNIDIGYIMQVDKIEEYEHPK